MAPLPTTPAKAKSLEDASDEKFLKDQISQLFLEICYKQATQLMKPERQPHIFPVAH